ncbi:MAG: formylglycine-generating enzyme family protein [Oscillatoriaceae cyanobacterium Prado104]|jgi:formylglycine-generating enzyme required for sulfatase activity|nr:formylglycine-generating enzyme family protein [Oscillatoriaceae cyanobacterium Prado104]
MSENQNEPKEYDAVLGGQNLIPVNAAVLGGIPGVKSRLASPAIETRIAALSEALKYGEAGLDLIIQALHDESMQVKLAAHSLLKNRDDLKIKPQFQDYLPAFEFDAIAVDAEGKENSRSQSVARYFREDLGNGVVLDMVYIPGGTFMMGSPANEESLAYERPQHQVTVSDFYIGKYPITQEQWQTVMENNPSHFRGEKRPVENISCNEAVEFCRKLSEKTGKSYRLPAEAEWEHACRARTTTPFYFGETITSDLVNYSTYEGNDPALRQLYFKGTTNVGSFPPNPFGLYDMHGNVWEWCSDTWHDNYDGAPTDGSSWYTRTQDEFRPLRGGSWCWYLFHSRSSIRRFEFATSHSWEIGFRPVAIL